VSRLPLRARLTVAFAAAMAIVLAATGWFVYARVGSSLAGALDQELRGRSQDIAAVALSGRSFQDGGSVRLIERGETFAQLVDRKGRVLEGTPTIGRTSLLSPDELARAESEPLFADRRAVPGLDEPARLLASPLVRDGRRLVLVVGGTRENRAETLHSLLLALLVSGSLALVATSVAGYLVAGAALRPVEAMRRRAAEISASRLEERLPVPPSGDELTRLGETLNAMLGRLEDAVERERAFVADASHELRSPLASLRAELELASKGGRSPDELRAAIASARDEADRVSHIADDLLLIARSEQGRLSLRAEATDVGDVLETVARRFGDRAQAVGRQVRVDTDEPSVVLADRLRLEQALGNLVDNALRHGGGEVVLSARAHDGRLDLLVRDAGRGFPPAFLGHAFERFSRADEARGRGGTGLGLAIVETVARAHGGSAHAANRRGGGADVWLSLPARRPPA
jgi:heavy metal sensor kinase